jgi:carbamoyl-phosphate synthase large subunit
MPKILFTSIGRRVQLVRHFLNYGWDVIGVDMYPEECAVQQIVQTIHRVPSFKDPAYFNRLLEICSHEKVDCIIPLFEPELIRFAELRPSFTRLGVRVLVTGENALAICNDKLSFFQFLRKNGFMTPDTFDNPDYLDNRSKWVVKPRTGMGSKDVFIGDYQDVLTYYHQVREPIIQRFIEGREYSIDIFVADSGKILSIVPRLRLEVRAGEVIKSVTVEDQELTNLTKNLVNKIGLTGPATIQGIRDEASGKFYLIEVNPRFGGGVPLTIEAGIPYAEFIKGTYDQKHEGLHPYKIGLKMLRYDEAVFLLEQDNK